MFPPKKLLCYEPVDFTPHDLQSKKIKLVIFLTLITFLVEITAGYLTASMALQADAWHMLTHILALSINLLAYFLSARFSKDQRFHFGVTKINSLAGYTSSLILFFVAVGMAVESIGRLIHPVNILFRDALIVAVIGLVVNLISAKILAGTSHNHDHHHEDNSHHHHHDVHQDVNYRSAYLHVMADALTSLMAIMALVVGLVFHWQSFDALIGILGGAIIVKWAYDLFKNSGMKLLDFTVNDQLQEKILQVIESFPQTEILDFHLWPHGDHSYYLMLSLNSASQGSVSVPLVKERLKAFEELKHITIEINSR